MGNQEYLCLAYYDEPAGDALSVDERQALADQCQPLNERLRASGYLLAQASLHSPRQSAVVRARNGKVTVDEGPFTVTKEQVGGFFIIEARDLNEAIRVAAMHPAGQLNEHLGWAVEVRSIEVFEPMNVYTSATV